jgi:glycosyltransferase involved in cell wall biosynthesis
MACGVPPVVSDVPGNRDVVADGVSGLLATTGDPVALADVLERVLGDRALRERLGTEARRTATRDYGFDTVTARYVELYATLGATTRTPEDAEERRHA